MKETKTGREGGREKMEGVKSKGKKNPHFQASHKKNQIEKISAFAVF